MVARSDRPDRTGRRRGRSPPGRRRPHRRVLLLPPRTHRIAGIRCGRAGSGDRWGGLHRLARRGPARGRGPRARRVGRVDPAGPRRREAPVGGGAASAPTSATRTRCGRRCAGSTPCVTRPRWWATAWTRATPRPTPPTTTSARPCCSPPCTRRASPGSCWPGRWSSTARAATPAASTASCGRGPATPTTSPPGGSSRPARSAAATSTPAWCPRTRRSTRAAPTPPPSSPRSTWRARGRARPGERCGRCATTTCTARGCRATPPTPGWRRCSGRRWNAANRRG